MMYPEHYAVLTSEEMEYTTGGSTLGAVLLAGGVAGAVLSGMVYSRQMEQVKTEMKEKNPELYAADDDQLAYDAETTFNASAAGFAINAVQMISGGCIGFGLADVVMDVVMGAVAAI